MIGLDEITRRCRLMIGLAHCGNGISCWCYGINTGKLFYSSCPYEEEFRMILDSGGCFDYAVSNKNMDVPMILSDRMGFIWICEVVHDKNGPIFLVLLGPVLNSPSSARSIENALKGMNTPAKIRNTTAQRIRSIPVVSSFAICQYAMMLHYLITDELITKTDIVYQKNAGDGMPPVHDDMESSQETSAERVYMMDETIRRVVREGNLEYRSVLSQFDGIGAALCFETGDPIREGKDNLIMLAVLCMQAAVEGGLSIKIARDMERDAIIDIERAETFTDLMDMKERIIKNFVESVHRCKIRPGMSRCSQLCCDYVNTHIKENIQLAEIASHMGYSEYYLTKKFYREMGVRLSDYIRRARIENAKIWLLSTNKSVQYISDELNFCSRNHFSKLFRKITGLTPAEYRKSIAMSDSRALDSGNLQRTDENFLL